MCSCSQLGLLCYKSCFYFCFSDEIFDNKAAGASPDATKALILITDLDPSDTDRKGIIKKYDEKNIIRLVIGVMPYIMSPFLSRLVSSVHFCITINALFNICDEYEFIVVGQNK